MLKVAIYDNLDNGESMLLHKIIQFIKHFQS